MLKLLHIENIAVIEKTDIEFTDGFNVLTGETGAGKSIIIDSINAVLGERTSRELIRNGCDRAEVSALFCDLSVHALQTLKENGYEPDEDGNLLVNRILSLNGNGSIRINGKVATASILKNISCELVNIHGQHDNQTLLQPESHYKYIDRLADNQKIIDEYYSEFKHLNTVRKELAALECDEDEKIRRKELLNFQIEELQRTDIKVGEADKIKEQLKIVDNYAKTLSSANEAYGLINGNEDSLGAVTLIKDAKNQIEALNGNLFDAETQKLNEILAMLEDVGFSIRKFTQNSEYSELDGEKLRDRLDELYRIMLKYGGNEEKSLEFLKNAINELNGIELSDEHCAALSDELDASTERLIKLGGKLTNSRSKAADKFSSEVTQALFDLDMPNVAFETEISNGKYTKLGCDVVEFVICTNAGEEKKPLHRIASGGELSRVMLAIKSVLLDKDSLDCMIFDEIDSGISGRAAGKVAKQLKKVSASRQVICITHLPQIAAYADNHIYIQKTVENGRTFTNTCRLDYESRIKEVARLMSGTALTDNLYYSAKELLDRSSNNADL